MFYRYVFYPVFRMEQKLAQRRAKVEGLKDQQEELRRQKRQNSDAQRQKLEAQLVSGP